MIEECLDGQECSLFALCDGTDAVFLGLAQDHKRVGDGDTGPNTGGMGAFSPSPASTRPRCMDAFIRPALAELARRGTPFRGILFAGLMLTAAGPRLIEYNVRFGDPECQALLPRLRSDLLPGLLAACEGELASFDLRWRDEACVAVVMAASGYPDSPQAGTAIDGLEAAAAAPGALIFQAGTRLRMATCSPPPAASSQSAPPAPTSQAARTAAYAAVDHIRWPEGFYRRDIAAQPNPGTG